MSASPLYRLTFFAHAPLELRGNIPLWRVNAANAARVVAILVRDVVAGDVIRLAPLDPCDPERYVTAVERLPPVRAGGGGRRPKEKHACHFCEQVSASGRLQDFTDGCKRWVCSSCIQADEMDRAQEIQDDL